MKRRKEASWDKGRSLERIAIAYANTRQNMWSELLEVLARDVGIDAKKLGWERLEAKVGYALSVILMSINADHEIVHEARYQSFDDSSKMC
jgi:hypothetical protein